MQPSTDSSQSVEGQPRKCPKLGVHVSNRPHRGSGSSPEAAIVSNVDWCNTTGLKHWPARPQDTRNQVKCHAIDPSQAKGIFLFSSDCLNSRAMIDKLVPGRALGHALIIDVQETYDRGPRVGYVAPAI